MQKNIAKILEYALKADENNDLIYGNAGAVIVLLNLYHLAQKDIYLQLACEAGEHSYEKIRIRVSGAAETGRAYLGCHMELQV